MLRDVQRGQSTIVTTEQSRSSLLSRLRKQRPVSVGRWSRDELYDDPT
ncbi:MAG: hypothetical protein JNL62_22305 [Bryobacterales bacterium]|nr:hypothetical protein [Bryobacterales bacterium]